MPMAGIAGGATSPADVQQQGGGNPFWAASNWYAEKISPVISVTTSAQVPQYPNMNINPGQFLRGVRFMMRSSGASGGTATADNPWNLFNNLELDNVDGSNILFPMNGYAHYLSQRYFRPWLGDPAARYDYTAGINPSGTLFLQPEIRHTAGVLSNTDSRSQYKYSASISNTAAIIATNTTPPNVVITPYMDAWAQPDAQDLTGVPNQPLPPGLNLQTQRRTEYQTVLSAGTTNTIISHLTGNELRAVILCVRDSLGARQDYIGDPVRWTLDNRNLGTLSPDQIFNWMQDFYGTATRPTGVYVLPRFLKPGELFGQGWLPTNNATKLQWEFATAAGATNMPGNVQIITDEVIPIGPIPPELDMI